MKLITWMEIKDKKKYPKKNKKMQELGEKNEKKNKHTYIHTINI